MKNDKPAVNILTRRSVLTKLGLAAVVGYAAPTLLSANKAEAHRRKNRRGWWSGNSRNSGRGGGSGNS